jgi:hypothetical protein
VTDPSENAVSIVISNNTSIFAYALVAAETCLPRRYLAMAVFSGFEASCHNMKRMYLEKW